MPNTTTKYHPGERQAVAISEAKEVGYKMHRLSEDLRDRLDELDRAIIEIQTTDDTKDLIALRERIERLHELRRMMELGSFMLQINQALDAAYKRLP